MVEVELLADPELIKSLFYNLIDNAVKASSPGQAVTLSAQTAEDGLRITLADQGRGIPARDIARITQPFYMVDKTRSRKAGGAGLGLALCVEIARVHQATLSITSQVGKDVYKRQISVSSTSIWIGLIKMPIYSAYMARSDASILPCAIKKPPNTSVTRYIIPWKNAFPLIKLPIHL